MQIKWNLSQESYEVGVNAIKTQNVDKDDFLGNLYIGHLSIDLTLMPSESETFIDASIYVGGVDSGYGYTSKNGLPYDYQDGFAIINKANAEKITTIDDFKNHILQESIKFIEQSKDETLIQKMNETSLFDWS